MAKFGRLLMLLLALFMAATASVAPDIDSWLTRPEVAARIRVPEKTLAQWASQHKGPRYRRFGRHVRYALSDLIAWEQAQFTGGDAA